MQSLQGSRAGGEFSADNTADLKKINRERVLNGSSVPCISLTKFSLLPYFRFRDRILSWDICVSKYLNFGESFIIYKDKNIQNYRFVINKKTTLIFALVGKEEIMG